VPPRYPPLAPSKEVRAGYDDDAAAFVVLFSDEDGPEAWLRGGEALGSVWGAAVEAGLAVMPFSTVVEVDAARPMVVRLLSGVGCPLLVLRLAHPDRTRGELPLAPRQSTCDSLAL
ncbi:MAG: nitroreductase, partial [Stackebrandtia sp.]